MDREFGMRYLTLQIEAHHGELPGLDDLLSAQASGEKELAIACLHLLASYGRCAPAYEDRLIGALFDADEARNEAALVALRRVGALDRPKAVAAVQAMMRSNSNRFLRAALAGLDEAGWPDCNGVVFEDLLRCWSQDRARAWSLLAQHHLNGRRTARPQRAGPGHGRRGRSPMK
jgi:hypothetical protein